MVLTGAALAATAYSAVLGSQLAKAGDVPVTGATGPADNTPAEVAKAQDRLRVVQWAIPALTGAVLVVSAQMGEQQRPTAVLGAGLGPSAPGGPHRGMAAQLGGTGQAVPTAARPPSLGQRRDPGRRHRRCHRQHGERRPVPDRPRDAPPKSRWPSRARVSGIGHHPPQDGATPSPSPTPPRHRLGYHHQGRHGHRRADDDDHPPVVTDGTAALAARCHETSARAAPALARAW